MATPQLKIISGVNCSPVGWRNFSGCPKVFVNFQLGRPEKMKLANGVSGQNVA